MSVIASVLSYLFVAIYAALALDAAYRDAKHLEIPNRNSIVIAIAFFPAAFLAGLAPLVVAQHMGVALTVLAVGVLLFSMGIIGGGDVKLLAAVAIWIAPADVGRLLIWMALFGGAIAGLVLLVMRAGLPMPEWLRRLPWLRPGDRGSMPVPYGIAIAAAALVMLPRLPVMP